MAFFFICIAVSDRTISVSYRSSRLVLPVGVVVSGARPVSRPASPCLHVSLLSRLVSVSVSSRRNRVLLSSNSLCTDTFFFPTFTHVYDTSTPTPTCLLSSRLVSSPRAPVHGDVGRFVRASTPPIHLPACPTASLTRHASRSVRFFYGTYFCTLCNGWVF